MIFYVGPIAMYMKRHFFECNLVAVDVCECALRARLAELLVAEAHRKIAGDCELAPDARRDCARRHLAKKQVLFL